MTQAERQADSVTRWPVGTLSMLLFVTLAVALALLRPSGDGPLRTESTQVAVGQVAVIVALFLLATRLRPSVVSPTWIVLAVATFVAFAGYYMQPSLAAAGGAGIRLALFGMPAEATSLLFSVSIVCIALGSAATAGRLGRRAKIAEFDPSWRTRILLYLATLVPIVMVTASQDWHTLIERDVYLRGEAGTNFAALGSNLAVVAVMVLGALFARARPGGRIVILAIATTYLLYFFALGSRRFALFPALFMLGCYGAKRVPWTRIGVVVSGLLSIAMLPIPLYMRSLPRHGLRPYWEALPAFANPPYVWEQISNNVLVSFPITGASAYLVSPMPSGWFWVQVNPMPGALTSWYDIAPSVMLNPSTPYSTLGMLGNLGWVYVVCFCVGLGALLGYFDRRVSILLARNTPLPALGIVALCALYSLFFVQYTLRAGVRLLLYALVLDLAARYWLHRAATRRPSGHRFAEANAPSDAERIETRTATN